MIFLKYFENYPPRNNQIIVTHQHYLQPYSDFYHNKVYIFLFSKFFIISLHLRIKNILKD